MSRTLARGVAFGDPRFGIGQANEPSAADAPGEIRRMMRTHESDANNANADCRLSDRGR